MPPTVNENADRLTEIGGALLSFPRHKMMVVAVALAVLLWRFVGEVLVPMLTRNPELSRWTPSGAANALVGLGGIEVLPITTAAVLLLGYTAVICGTAGALFTRTDPA